MWQLRHNLSGYDATFVALAEQTDATSQLTTDARLAGSPRPTCMIEWYACDYAT
jgi:predicted nucleic acid-binding protein